MLISPHDLDTIIKIQKNFHSKTKLRGPIYMRIKEKYIGRHFGSRTAITRTPKGNEQQFEVIAGVRWPSGVGVECPVLCK